MGMHKTASAQTCHPRNSAFCPIATIKAATTSDAARPPYLDAAEPLAMENARSVTAALAIKASPVRRCFDLATITTMMTTPSIPTYFQTLERSSPPPESSSACPVAVAMPLRVEVESECRFMVSEIFGANRATSWYNAPTIMPGKAGWRYQRRPCRNTNGQTNAQARPSMTASNPTRNARSGAVRTLRRAR